MAGFAAGAAGVRADPRGGGRAAARSDIYGWKLTLLVVALCNAALFRWRWHGRIDGIMPLAARAMALLSLALWLTIAVLGRWIAYG